MATANGRSARVRKFLTRRGAELGFTESGFGGGPLGNLYRPMTEKEARLTLEAVMGFRLPIFRHRAALRLRAFGNATERLPAPETAQLLPGLDQGRSAARPLQAGGALAAERVFRNAVAPRALRLHLRRGYAVARIFARASRPRRDRHRVRA